MSWELASPAPHVSGRIKVEPPVAEPAVATPVEHAEAPVVAPCASVETPIVEPAAAELSVGYSGEAETRSKEEKTPSKNYSDGKFDPEDLMYTTVENLRDDGGTDFESYAAVLRGNPGRSLLQRCHNFFMKERDFVAYGEVSFSQ